MSTSITHKFFFGVLKDGTPAEEGARLARALLAKEDTDWDDLTVDFRGMSIELHGITYFCGFLQEIAAARPEILERARKVKWTLSYPVLEPIIDAYMTGFQPRASRIAA